MIAANLSIRGGVNVGFVIESKHVRETANYNQLAQNVYIKYPAQLLIMLTNLILRRAASKKSIAFY